MEMFEMSFEGMVNRQFNLSGFYCTQSCQVAFVCFQNEINALDSGTGGVRPCTRPILPYYNYKS